MQTVSAIETSYKGYRFRSRLEARWAMFFDRVGLTWTYEQEPIRVNGEAYLPDFKVDLGDRKPVLHEVKSLHEWERIQPIDVYLAGKMSAAHDWRGEASPLARTSRHGACSSRLGSDPEGAWRDASHMTSMSGTSFNLVGPFPVSDDHGCGHSPAALHMSQSCAFENEHLIVRACRDALLRADLMCVHISTADAFGTLVEIGWASALGVRISMTLTTALARQIPRRGPAGHWPGWAKHDMWFAQELAQSSALVANDAEARAFHAENIRKETPREYRLISGIGMAGSPAMMTFGDPLDVFNRGLTHEWGVKLLPVIRKHHAAAEAIRAHRFDGR